MPRLVAVFLFTLFSFLFWLYFANYHSDISDWWTVNHIIESTPENEIITMSPTKLFIGLSAFILIGTLLSIIVMKRK
ncbi:hypothetical protein [Sutcliffiella halmapala]|uniref:hypothetical protein n=1 Tax=Sutcliffiella halmapala TaxID=79882 RepID=UPI00099590AE|nr:hypothetical protein [Sutcliffiella halmapala]